MTPRDRRPDNEQGPINWGIMPKKAPRAKTTATRAGGNGLLEVVRSGNNPAPAGSVVSDASAASATSAPGSADGAAGPRDAGSAALMTEEDMRSAAAQAIASGTADAVDAAIAIDLADAAGDGSGWTDSASPAGPPASPRSTRGDGQGPGETASAPEDVPESAPETDQRITADDSADDAADGTADGAADEAGGDSFDENAALDGGAGDPGDDSEKSEKQGEQGEHGESAETGAPASPAGKSPDAVGSAADSPAAVAAGQQSKAGAGVVNDSRSPRPVVRPAPVDGSNASRQGATTTTRVFTISQGKPTVEPTASSGAGAPPPPAAPGAAAPSTSGYGYQSRPSSGAGCAPGAAPSAVTNTTEAAANTAATSEDDPGILAESSAWEAATNALDTEEIKAQGGGTDWGVGRGPAKGRGPRRPSSGTDWGVGRGPAKSSGARTRSPWPAAVRRQRLAGVAFALAGLLLATVSAMNLARNAEIGHLWIPPWLVAVLGGAGLVAAAGYLAWAGGTPLRREAERWKPGVLDAAAGLTTGTVKVNDPARLVARARGPLLLGTSERGDETAPTVESGPKPVMGTSTVDQSTRAPAGVAGAVGGFMLAGAVVCAVVALILGPEWLIATAALSLGGIVAIRLAGEWLGQF